MVTRLAILIAGLLAVATGLLAFLPAEANGNECGVWLSPKISKAETQSLIDESAALQDQIETDIDVPGNRELSERNQRLAAGAASAYSECDSALDSRRLWTLLAFGAALVLPTGVLFVAGSDD